MPTHRLVARVDTDAQDDSFLVRAPTVGMVDGVPAVGVYLNPMEGFLTLTVLNRRHVVQLPRNVQGRVVERFIEDTAAPVAYNQPLFRLSQLAAELPAEGASARAATTAEGAIDADLITVTAPSEGVFYRRPGPDSPPYVEAGSAVSIGSVLGLVEVMKSFNQITYGGPGLPERGRVERVLVEDAAEVAFGQTLFLIRPE
jgi:biotin carboxyl carrier protein